MFARTGPYNVYGLPAPYTLVHQLPILTGKVQLRYLRGLPKALASGAIIELTIEGKTYLSIPSVRRNRKRAHRAQRVNGPGGLLGPSGP